MIELKKVTKKYDRVVLDNINLEFKTNNIYVIKGISGSGKTTLLNIIAMVDKDYEGEVIVNNINLKKGKKKFLKNYVLNIGYMMQKSLLYKKINIMDNLLMVENDKNKIISLAKIFKIEDLLDKFPSEVSGGELQRIGLIRALLNDNKVLILDEATSNLDHSNSINFAEYLKEIDLKDKIVIIATHKDIYDDICNSLINISYGKVEIKFSKLNKDNDLKLENKKRSKKLIFKNALKLRPKQNIIIYGFLSLLLAALLGGLSFFVNYKEAYLKKKLEDFPLDILDVSKEYYNEIKNMYDIDYEYKKYTYEEKGFTYYELFYQKDSTFKKNIKGEFPENDNEVLVNQEYVSEYFKDSDKVIGSKLTINNKQYEITGIINGKDIPMLYNIYDDIYDDNIVKSAVFIPYDEIKKYGNLDDQIKYIKVNINELGDLYTYDELGEMKLISFASSVYAMYENRMAVLINHMENPVKASVIAVIIILILTFVFLYNEITMELYFRQREFGYLQLFHFAKSDVSDLIILEYLINMTILFIISLFLYIGFIGYINIFYNLNLFLSIPYIILYFVIFMIIIYLIIFLSSRKYLKKNIINLIK